MLKAKICVKVNLIMNLIIDLTPAFGNLNLSYQDLQTYIDCNNYSSPTSAQDNYKTTIPLLTKINADMNMNKLEMFGGGFKDMLVKFHELGKMETSVLKNTTFKTFNENTSIDSLELLFKLLP